MLRVRWLVVTVVGLSLASCISTVPAPTLSEAASKVRVATADPSGSCEDLGPVSSVAWDEEKSANYAINYKDDNQKEEIRRIKIRNQTAAKGGNVVRMETKTTDRIGRARISGTAFKCN